MSKNVSLILCLSALSLIGCGGADNDLSPDSTSQKPDNVIQQDHQTAPRATSPKPSAKPVLTHPEKLDAQPDYIFSVKPAEFTIIPFSKFRFKNQNGAAEDNLPSSFEKGTAVISATGFPGDLSDDDVEARITGRELVVVGPVIPRSDNASHTEQRLTLIGRDNQQVTVLIKTSAPDIGATIIDNSHFESDPKPRLVSVKGLSPSGTLGGSGFTLSLDTGGAIETARAYSYGLDKNDNQIIVTENISDLIKLDSIAPSLSIQRSALQGVLSKVPTGAASLEFEIQQQYDHNNVSVQFFNGSTLLKGQLIDGNHNPLMPDMSQNEKLEILIKGASSNYRRIVTIDPNGMFVIDNLPAGETYSLTVSDLRFPNLFHHYVVVYDNTTQVEIALYYDPDNNGLKQGVSSRTTQNGHVLSRAKKK